MEAGVRGAEEDDEEGGHCAAPKALMQHSSSTATLMLTESSSTPPVFEGCKSGEGEDGSGVEAARTGGAPVLREDLVCMYSRHNLALTCSYFTVGVVETFSFTPMTVYAVETLNADPDVVSILSTLTAVPFCFKLFFGLLSDLRPIYGCRRKPYVIIGWVVHIVANLVLAAHPHPKIESLILLTWIFVTGFMLSDVVSDAMLVERACFEQPGKVGSMQGVAYVCRYVGDIMASILGMVLYNRSEWGWGMTIQQVFLLNALLPTVMVMPVTKYLRDPPVHPRSLRTLGETCKDIWNLLQRRSVYGPVAFIIVYNSLMIPNGAWANFLIHGLGFQNWQIGLVTIAATVASWLGVVFYRAVMSRYSLRTAFVMASLTLMLFMLADLPLIFRMNIKWGVRDLVYVAVNDSVGEFLMGVTVLPTIILFVHMCPKGSEGATFATLTTLSTVAESVGFNAGTLMTWIWDVSNHTLALKDFQGLWRLSTLIALLQPASLLLVFLLPRKAENVNKRRKRRPRKHKLSDEKQPEAEEEEEDDDEDDDDEHVTWGGAALLAFLIGAWLWTLLETFILTCK